MCGAPGYKETPGQGFRCLPCFKRCFVCEKKEGDIEVEPGWVCQQTCHQEFQETFKTRADNPLMGSRTIVTQDVWTKALEARWSEWATQDSHLLIISGTHGGRDGGIENMREDKFYREDLNVKKHLEGKYKDEIKTKNMKIDVLNLGELLEEAKKKETDKTKVDVRVIEKIRQYKATHIVLAYCFSHVSELQEVMESYGLSGEMRLRWEHCLISNGRGVWFDLGQREFLQKVVEQSPWLSFLWGSPGTVG